MKMIKIVLRNDSCHIVDQYKFDLIMKSQNQLIMLSDYAGNSLFKGFNKADIVEFYQDRDATETVNEKIKSYLKAKSMDRISSLDHKTKSIGEYAEANSDTVLYLEESILASYVKKDDEISQEERQKLVDYMKNNNPFKQINE